MRIEEHKGIMKAVGWPKVFLTLVRAIPLIVSIAWRSAAMCKRWPWDSFAAYMDTPLREIRREFRIRPIVVVA